MFQPSYCLVFYMRCLWWGRIRSGMTWPADGDLKRSSCEWPVAGTQQSGGWCVSPEIQGAGIWASTNVRLSRKHLSWDQNDMIVFTPGVIVLTLHPHLPLWSSERQSNLLHITQLTRSNASCLPAQGCFLYASLYVISFMSILVKGPMAHISVNTLIKDLGTLPTE